tara:strand:+ start:117 stop:2021 length:1905 start_codon:yes stop_codon:yes gene_type:complete
MQVERKSLPSMQRVVVKLGTSTVSRPDGFPALSRLAAIVEQIVELHAQGKEVIIVTSGAVGIGKQKLRQQSFLGRSIRDTMRGRSDSDVSLPADDPNRKHYNSACAAAGQLGLMALYDSLFSHFSITTSQFLLTSDDFTTKERRGNLLYSLNTLLDLGVIPLINENDAISANQGYTDETTFSDNDGLAALVAAEVGAQLLVLFTDVDGVFDRPPSEAGAAFLSTVQVPAERGGADSPLCGVRIGATSAQGRGGMRAKMEAAMRAVRSGVQACIIAKGGYETLTRIVSGEQVGTMFISGATDAAGGGGGGEAASGRKSSVSGEDDATTQATAAREGSRQLQALSPAERSAVLFEVASALEANADFVLSENAADVATARSNGTDVHLLARLSMTRGKIATLASGIRALAEAADEPIGRILSKTELAEGLELTKVTTPIGVLLIIFESRPDSLPQIAALALRSGNGLLLKGGKEAARSNAALHGIIAAAIERSSGGRVQRGVIGLIAGRAETAELLKLDTFIDLVIPRGSTAMVNRIKSMTRIPVLGHAEGVCHVYVDAAADSAMAQRIVVDAKTNYPAACNACETVLFHEATIGNGVADQVMRALKKAGVKALGGPNAIEHGLVSDQESAPSLSSE